MLVGRPGRRRGSPSVHPIAAGPGGRPWCGRSVADPPGPARAPTPGDASPRLLPAGRSLAGCRTTAVRCPDPTPGRSPAPAPSTSTPRHLPRGFVPAPSTWTVPAATAAQLRPGFGKPIPTVPATPDLVAEDIASGFCGAVTACTASTVTLEDFKGRTRTFPLDPASFAIDGEVVTLVRPQAAAPPPVRRSPRPGRSPSRGHTRPHRPRGPDLGRGHPRRRPRRAGVGPRPPGRGHRRRADRRPGQPGRAARRVRAGRSTAGSGVLCDHLVPGSKESRIADTIGRRRDAAAVLITGHPYIDIWQAVRPTAVRIPAWPDVPRGEDWKHGVCARLGISDPAVMWGRVNGSVTHLPRRADPVDHRGRAADRLRDRRARMTAPTAA